MGRICGPETSWRRTVLSTDPAVLEAESARIGTAKGGKNTCGPWFESTGADRNSEFIVGSQSGLCAAQPQQPADQQAVPDAPAAAAFFDIERSRAHYSGNRSSSWSDKLQHLRRTCRSRRLHKAPPTPANGCANDCPGEPERQKTSARPSLPTRLTLKFRSR